MEFCNLDLNDKYLEFCGSICFSQNHHIRMNSVFFPREEMDMNFADFRNAVNCYLQERKLICNFCQKCFDCKRFNNLKSEYEYFLRRNRSKKLFHNNIYITTVRFN